MTFRTILGNEHIRSKYGNFKEQSFKPQIVNKTQLYGNLHIRTHNINNKITEISGGTFCFQIEEYMNTGKRH